MNRLKLLFILFFSLTFLESKAQVNLDSLENIVASEANDSLKVEALYYLALSINNTPEGVEYALAALELAEKNNLRVLAGQILNSLGIFYYRLGNYEQTLDYFYKALSYHQSIGDTSSMAKNYNNIGLILTDLGRIDETVTYHKLALKLKEKLGDSLSIASSYSNLGVAYQELGKLDSAMYYFRMALKIDKNLNSAPLELFIDYNNIGKNHFLEGEYDSTKYYYNKAVMLSDKINVKYNKAEMLLEYGRLNEALNEYERAAEKYNAGLMLATEAEAKALVRDAFKELSELKESQGEIEEAFKYYQKYDSVNDLIYNEEQTKKIAQVENSFQIQRGEKEIEILKKEAEIKDLRIRNDRFLKYSLGAALFLIIALVVLQYRKNVFKTKTNDILKVQNDDIVNKNKNIMDSIAYAKNIQKAILPSHNKLNQIFNDSFVYSKARDVVNGDFYWITSINDKVILAAVDCTGHGVPAAFINVLGNTHLNSIVKEQEIHEPAKILQQLNKRMLNSISTNQDELKPDDGMDIALCMIDKSTGKVLYAGAKRPFYYINNKELYQIKGDGLPIGGESYPAERTYTEHEISLNKGDSIYLFTDGVIDQFGGPRNKKFMYPRLRDLLVKIQDHSMEKQYNLIKKELKTWKGNNDQTDDWLILGVRL